MTARSSHQATLWLSRNLVPRWVMEAAGREHRWTCRRPLFVAEHCHPTHTWAFRACRRMRASGGWWKNE